MFKDNLGGNPLRYKMDSSVCISIKRVAMGFSRACGCGISWSYSLTIVFIISKRVSVHILFVSTVCTYFTFKRQRQWHHINQGHLVFESVGDKTSNTQRWLQPVWLDVCPRHVKKTYAISTISITQQRLWRDCSDQTWRMPRLIRTVAGCKFKLLVLWCAGMRVFEPERQEHSPCQLEKCMRFDQCRKRNVKMFTSFSWATYRKNGLRAWRTGDTYYKGLFLTREPGKVCARSERRNLIGNYLT